MDTIVKQITVKYMALPIISTCITYVVQVSSPELSKIGMVSVRMIIKPLPLPTSIDYDEELRLQICNWLQIQRHLYDIKIEEAKELT